MSKANIKRDVIGGDSKNPKEVNEYTITVLIEKLRAITQIEIEQETSPFMAAFNKNELAMNDSNFEQDNLMEGKVNMYLLALLT